VNDETKEQSKWWMQTHSPRKPRKLKRCLPAGKLMAIVFWDRKSADVGICARDHNNVKSVMQNAKKNCVGPFRTQGVEC
jgi:hypothetical protein